jgi:hypothetical protein
MQDQVREIESLEQGFSAEAKCLRDQAKLLPPGTLREQVLRKARQAETGAHIGEWLESPGLKPPQ